MGVVSATKHLRYELFSFHPFWQLIKRNSVGQDMGERVCNIFKLLLVTPDNKAPVHHINVVVVLQQKQHHKRETAHDSCCH